MLFSFKTDLYRFFYSLHGLFNCFYLSITTRNVRNFSNIYPVFVLRDQDRIIQALAFHLYQNNI